ncbi:unnamed protein product [Closterium sp. NIES-54]
MENELAGGFWRVCPHGSMPNRAMPTHRLEPRRVRVHLSTAGQNRPRCYFSSVEGAREAKPNIFRGVLASATQQRDSQGQTGPAGGASTIVLREDASVP